MTKEKLFATVYNTLNQTEREDVLRAIVVGHPRFNLLRFEHFERFGMSTDTAVYGCEGVEYVFVPGDTVTLGWEDFAVGMDESTRNDMIEALEELGIANPNLDTYLRESMSPIRMVKVSPMLVERDLNDIGWRRVALDSPELVPFQKYIQKYHGQIEVNNKMRMYKNGDELIAEMYDPVSMDDFLARVHESGFSLPTEDEWEYLCGGGSRTLFRWGDSFDYDMKLYCFERGKPADAPYTLELPNQFGLSIAYNPYRYEVVEGSEYFLKGGDGGCNICGVSGIVLGYLPTATYFRGYSLSEDTLGYKTDIGGDYTFYRRIFRL